MASKVGTDALKGQLLVAAITSVCSSGFLLFGYDQGVMSGVVISKYWLSQMGTPSTLMIGTITALYDVGAVIGAVAAAFSAEPLGRKQTLQLGTWILIIGTILMGSCYERIQMMFARVITGIGIGYITSVAPVYQSEISPAAQRGWQVCCQLTTMLFGLMLAYWINYGFYFHPGNVQWRFPLLFQLVFATYIVIVTPFLPDTPRWLMRHEPNPDRGIIVLTKLRNKPAEHEDVRTEAAEIQEAIAIEAKEEGTWMDLFRDNDISANKRFYLSLGIQFMQQMSGINIVTYYSPTLFQVNLGMSQRMALLMGCVLQVWYIAASFVTWWTIDRVGRRKLLFSMAIGMCVVLILEAICVRVNSRSSGIAAIIWVFAFEACFTWGWMACVWIYPPEILPLKIRAKGASLAAAADKTYIIFAVLNIANAVIIWLFYPETKSLPLEAVDMLFKEDREAAQEAKRETRFYHRLQWSVVARAALDIKRRKEGRRNTLSNIEESVPDSRNGSKKSSLEHVERMGVKETAL